MVSSLSDLRPNEKNPRKISDQQLKALRKSLEKFGDLSGIIFNRKTERLCGGHQRIKVLPADSKIVIEQKYDEPTKTGTVTEGSIEVFGERFKYREVEWDENTEKAANLAANKHGGEFEMAMVADWINELHLAKFDMDLTGFNDDEVKKMLRQEIDPKCDEDEVPEQVDTICKPGDIWLLGSHRLMCGDSTSIDQVENLMAGERADMVFTSPPYNVGIDYNSHDDKMTLNQYADFMRSVMATISAVLKNGRIVAWNVGVSPKSAPHRHVNWLEENGFNLYRNIVWKKTGCQIPLWQNSKKNPLARYYLPNYNHEMIYLVSKGEVEKGAATEMPEELSMDVWDVSQFSAGGNNHPAAFPVHLAEMAVQVLSAKDEIAFEPFGGSGSTLIACEKTNRKCFMMEIDPHYCDVIIARWEKYTGKKAERCET